MTREEFMTELASMLQDISVEERVEAMQYYNDYFDDAGEEQEEKVAAKLGSPAKVAAEVKAGLERSSGETSEYRETGYTDTRFEEQVSLAKREDNAEKREEYSYHYAENVEPQKNSAKKDKVLKIVAMIVVGLAAAPILISLAVGALCIAFGIVITVFAILFALIVVAVTMVIVGIVLFISGMITAVSQLPTGFALLGMGLIVAVVGVVLTVAFIKLCFVVVPMIGKWIKRLWQKIMNKRKVVA